MAIYLSALIRIIIGIVFTLSFSGKIRNIQSFQETIIKFRLLPALLSRILGFVFLIGELAVSTTMIFGGRLLSYGFLLACILLIIFSIAIGSALLRKIDTSCDCFGSSESRLSSYDVIRNVGFILCALVGYIATFMAYGQIEIIEYLLLGAAGVVIVIIWINLESMVRVFQIK